jgi:hypothetical protein
VSVRTDTHPIGNAVTTNTLAGFSIRARSPAIAERGHRAARFRRARLAR